MTASPRERLLATASDLVRQHGVAGTGLAELLEKSGTARGSIYQHFPEGKDQLIEAATDIAGEVMRGDAWSTAPAADAQGVVRQVVDRARTTLRAEGFSRGCPVVAAAVAGPDHDRVVRAASRAFATWTEDLAAALRAAGLPRASATSFASVLISAVEGAIVQSRAQQSTKPLDAVADHLGRAAQAIAAG
jgi:AcrR family transcriptional regulator